jgi:hypothetical protein
MEVGHRFDFGEVSQPKLVTGIIVSFQDDTGSVVENTGCTPITVCITSKIDEFNIFLPVEHLSDFVSLVGDGFLGIGKEWSVRHVGILKS